LVKALTRRTASAVATAVAVAALAWALGVRGCGDAEGTPEGVVRAFVAAARAEDKAALWDLLGPESRKAVEAEAKAATDRIGGSQRLAPLDVLDVAAPARSYAPGDIVLRDSDGHSATVDVLGPEGRHDSVRAVKVGGRWRVELWSRGAAGGGKAARTE
jgi:hypothetical protein